MLGWVGGAGVAALHRARQAHPKRLCRKPDGRLRDECLNEHPFRSSAARHTLELWRIDYNTQRPHTSLNGLTPFTFVNRPPWTTTPTNSGYDRGQQGGKVT